MNEEETGVYGKMNLRKCLFSSLFVFLAIGLPLAQASKDGSKGLQSVDIDKVKNDEQFAELYPDYRIRFTGLIEEERELTLKDIVTLHKNQIETRTFEGTRTDGETIELSYTGINLAVLLEDDKVRADAKNLVVYGTDKYSASLPIVAMNADEVYLVWKKEGRYMVPSQDGVVKVVQNGGETRTWVKNPVLFDFVSLFRDTVPLEDRLSPNAIDFLDQERLFTLSILSTQKIDVDTWQLEITGLVANPATYTYADILHMPQETVYAVLETISNPPGGRLIGNAVWTGVPLSYVLEQAGPDPSVLEVVFKCADGYSTSITLEEAEEEGVLLCYRVNGETLLPKHGFPLRLVVPGKYGMKWPKWITAMEFVDYDYKGYWERRGWSDYAGRDRPDQRYD
jgi:DMSO/TMAO reductase YedYZ molybdopterin-dependent catalytic subunit